MKNPSPYGTRAETRTTCLRGDCVVTRNGGTSRRLLRKPRNLALGLASLLTITLLTSTK